MAPKEKPTEVNPISNVNNNTNSFIVNLPSRKRSTAKKKSEPNWYTRTIVGGIIALFLSIGGYYIKKNLDEKSKNSTIVVPNGQPLEGTKQN
jgi:hypothetical protein